MTITIYAGFCRVSPVYSHVNMKLVLFGNTRQQHCPLGLISPNVKKTKDKALEILDKKGAYTDWVDLAMASDTVFS